MPFVLAAILGLAVAAVPALFVIAALLVWWVFEEISDYEKRLNPPDLSFKMQADSGLGADTRVCQIVTGPTQR